MRSRILYVEDDNDTAESIKMILNFAGYSVDTARTGKEGVKKGKEGMYDLALIDIMLPDMPGWDVYKQLKNDMLIAFLTSLPTTKQQVRKLKKEGVKEYLTKPIAKKELINAISQILSNDRETRLKDGKNTLC